jgi:hypothetical protein
MQIDGREQNELRPEWIFRLFESSHAEHVAFAETADCVEYTGRHHGYERFDPSVTHERTLRLSRSDGTLTIVDRLSGRGVHDLRWHFHLAPGLHAAPLTGGTVQLSTRNRRWTLRGPEDLLVSIAAGDYSPSYGVKQACHVIDIETTAHLDGAHTWTFSITP